MIVWKDSNAIQQFSILLVFKDIRIYTFAWNIEVMSDGGSLDISLISSTHCHSPTLNDDEFTKFYNTHRLDNYSTTYSVIMIGDLLECYPQGPIQQSYE